MNKKLLLSVLVSLMFISFFTFGVSANSDKKSLPDRGASDVTKDNSYYNSVISAYELILKNENVDGTSDPDGKVSVAEALALVSQMNSIFYGENEVFTQGSEWYSAYVDYALKKGFITVNTFDDYNRPIKRREIVSLFSKALPDECYPAINKVSSIPDVSPNASYANDALKLYKAGIMMGDDVYGTFQPSSDIAHSEIYEIINRITQLEKRIRITLVNASSSGAYYLLDDDKSGASGWSIDSRGAVPSKNQNSSYISDISDEYGTAFIRDLVVKKGGSFTLETSFSTISGLNGLYYRFTDSSDNIVYKLFTENGKISVLTDNGSIALLDGEAKKTYLLKITVNLDEGTSTTVINNVNYGTYKLPGSFTEVAQYKIGSTEQAKIVFTPGVSRIYCNYKVNEQFSDTSAEHLSAEWTVSKSDETTVSTEKGEFAANGNNFAAQKSFEKIGGNVGFETIFNLPEGSDGLAIDFGGDGMSALTLTSLNSKFFINGTELYGFTPNVWYTYKVEADTENRKADIFLNHKLIKTVDFASAVSTFDFLKVSFNSTTSQAVKFDNVYVYPIEKRPEDYVPKPEVASSDNYDIGINICSLWRNGGKNRGWDCITPFDEIKPLLGYYDDGNPEVADWEIKWMSEHGIDFGAYCWFASESNAPIKTTEMSEALLYGYMNAKYSDKTKFALLWESANGKKPASSEAFRNYFVPYWVEYFFKDSRYMTIDNKPVIGIFGYSSLINSFGSAENAKAELDYVREVCKGLGFDGAIFIGCTTSTGTEGMDVAKAMGLDAVYAYNWTIAGYDPDITIDAIKTQQDSGILNVVPTISTGFNNVAWNGTRSPNMSCADFDKVADWIKSVALKKYPSDSWNSKLVMMSTWNEYGEGTYMMPSGLNKFGYLDAIRRNFTDAPVTHTDSEPTENQLGRLSTLYPQDRAIISPLRTVFLQMEGTVIERFDFQNPDNVANYVIENLESYDIVNGILVAQASNSDPKIGFNNLEIDASKVNCIKVTLKPSISGIVKVYFTTALDQVPDEKKSLKASVLAGVMQTYYIPIENPLWDGTITYLRFDPINAKCKFEAESLELLYANPDKTVIFNGNKLSTDIELKHTAEDTFLPLNPSRSHLNYLNAYHEWNKAEGVLAIYANHHEAVFTMGNKTVMVDGQPVELVTPPYLVDGLPMIPLHFLANALQFSYEETGNEIILTSDAKKYFVRPDNAEPYSFEFNITGANEGWSLANAVQTFEEEGAFAGISTKNGSGQYDPVLGSPELNICAEDYGKIVISMKHEITNKTKDNFKIYFKVKDRNVSEDTAVSIPIGASSNGAFVEYTFDMSKNANWKGTIESVRVDPFDAAGTFAIDSIRFVLNKQINVAITSTSDTITAVDGTVNLAANVTANQPLNDYGVIWKTDTVNAVMTKNADGSVTLTGKINGQVNVTAISKEDGKSYATKTITISGQDDKTAKYDLKVMLFGNSILKHSPSPGIGWYGNWGMAASSQDKDYVHRLMDYYAKNKYGTLDYSLYSIYGFESAIVAQDNYDYTSVLAPIKAAVAAYQPDIVNLQMGENGSASGLTAAQYANAVGQLVQTIQAASPGVKIMLCTPFWGGAAKVPGIQLVADKYNLPISDLATLNTDENKAIGLFENSGVAIHPGDTGMNNIAKLIWANMDNVISDNFVAQYVYLPATITVSSNADAITTDAGTLQMSSAVLPAQAGQQVAWSVDNTGLAAIDANGLLTARNNGTVVVTAASTLNNVYGTKTITISGQSTPYTVTYLAGTTDTVTNLPGANTLAKGTFTLSKQKPVRTGYQFTGWSLTENGNVVDTITVTGDTTVYAVWRKASIWEFNENDYLEGMTVQNGFNIRVSDGKLMTIATGTDAASGNVLRITSPALDLTTADYKAFILKMKNTVFNANSKVKLVVQTTEGDKTYETPVTSMNDTQYGFDISDCTGTITGFYFEPTNVDCTINVDYIGFASGIKVTYHANTTEPVTGMPGTEYVFDKMNYTVSTAKPARTDYRLVGWSETPDGAALVGNQISVTTDKTLYAVWKYNDSWDFNTANDFEGWSTAGITNASVSGGILSAAAKNVGTEASPRYDPVMWVTPAKVDTSVYDKVVVRIAYTLPAGKTSTALQVYFTTQAQPSMSEATVKSTTLSGNSSNGFIDVVLDMSTNSLWGGSKLTSLRIDPIYGAGSFQIDSIKLLAGSLTQEWNFDDNTANGWTAWGSHSIAAANGAMTVTNTGLTQGAGNSPSVSLDTSAYKYLVLGVKSATAPSIKFYFKCDANGYNETNTRTVAIKPGSTFTEYVVDFSTQAGWSGYFKQFMLNLPSAGSVTFDYIKLTDKYEVPVIPPKQITVAITSTSDTITAVDGTVNLTANVTANQPLNDYGVIWKTDTVNAVMTKNADGSLTLTGKINGQVNVTAISKEDGKSYATKTITISGQDDKTAKYDLKVMLFGNSILKHSPDAGIGWYGNWGMAASAQDKDYVHRLMDYYAKNKYGTLDYSLYSIFGFESAIVAQDNYDYTSVLAPIKAAVAAYQPDIVNLQMGENGSASGLTAAQYANAVGQLVQTIQAASPGVKIMLCTPFWGGVAKIPGIQLVADKYNLPISDLATLNTDENKAIGLFENSGVAIHPGDTGMNNIAKLIWANMDNVISDNFTAQYVYLPATITVSSNADAITTDAGTLQMSSAVLPAQAGQQVAWSVDNTGLAAIDANGLLTARNNGTVVVTAASTLNNVYGTKTITISGQSASYTVTYLAGTTDTVTNLPGANTLAKGTFTLSKQKPLRTGYQFIGWSLMENGNVADTITITGDTTVYAVWRKASTWEFNENDYLEGMTVQNGFNIRVSDGKLMTIATGTDAASGNVLRITSPALDLTTADYKAFILKMQNTVFNANSKVKLVVQTTEGDKTYETPVTSMNDTQYGFDISDCTGTITGFYFEPTNVDCTINVDYIRFASAIKVTYHANTTDTVTGMPGTEYVVAGMNYTVSTAKPTRIDYRLVGWSETPDGAALVGNQIPVTADKTLYAIWKYNDSWDFSTDNDFEGWSTVNLMNALVSGGILSATAKNIGTDASPRYDPIIGVTPAKVDTSVYNKVVVRMAYTLPAGITSTTLQVYFTTEAQPSMSEGTLKSTTLSGNSSNGFIDVELDMSTNSLWGGSKLTSLRIDPIYGAGSFQIDSIKLVAVPHEYAWNFNTDGDFEGWTGYMRLDSRTVSGGYYSMNALGYASSQNPAIYSPSTFTCSASGYPVFKVKLKNETACSSIGIYFTTAASPNFSESMKVSCPITANSAEYKEYTFDLSQNTSWTGTFKQFMITFGNVTGNISIDYIKLCEPSTVPITQVYTQEWNFNDNTANDWTAWGSHSITAANGALTVTNTGLSQGAANSPSVSFDTSVYKYLVLGVNSATASNVKFYFKCDANAYNETNTKTVAVTPGSTFTEYVVDLSTLAGWSGSFKQFMLNLTSAGSVTFDYIKLTNKMP